MQLGLFSRKNPAASDCWLCVRIDYSEASDQVKRWHYSGCMPRGYNVCFGLYRGSELYAVAVFGTGVNSYQDSYLARVTGLAVTAKNLVELKRLARSSPKRKYPMTKFMSECHRILKDENKIRYVISFSDPDQGHTGTLYRAANYIHIGKTNAEMHVIDRDGVRRHRRVAYRLARRRDIPIAAARAELGFTCIKTSPRDRWFLPLFKKDRKSLERFLKSGGSNE